MDAHSKEFDYNIINEEMLEKITFGQLWGNQPPVMHWCFGVTCLSFGFVYMLLFTML